MSTDRKRQVEQILERYGVWVKASPWEADKGTDFELLNIDDSGDGELPITEEEERLLSKLETASHTDDSINMPEAHVPKVGDSDSKSPDEFHRIEEKLDALRDEIRYLKDEISELKLPSPTQVEDSEKSGGYFDDEDDETIALTDDELVHILDSADVTDGTVDKAAEKNVEEDTAKSDSAAELDKFDEVAMEPLEAEQANLDGESIVNLDGIDDLSGEDEDFEEITGIEISGEDTAADAVIEDSTVEQDREIGDSQDSYDVIETAESEAFDEGEEVEIGLKEEEDVVHEREAQDVEMEEVSLDEFGFDMHMGKTASTASDLTDKTRNGERLPDTESIETTEADSKIISEDDAIGQTAYSDAPGENENEVIENENVRVDDKSFEEAEIELPDEMDGLDIVDEEAAAEEVIEEEIELPDETDGLDIVDEEAAAEEVIEEEIELPDETDELDIIELDDEVSDASDIVVGDGGVLTPEDAYRELPGTEKIDLDSLEALASSTQTTEVEKPERMSTTDSISEEAALPGVSSELRGEIRDVLKYMDQLLSSLPEEKVEEFRRSEHFEVYKKIFEELEISN